MRAGDFKPCASCGKGVAHTGVPLFYRVTVESMGIDGRAVQRAHGMELFMGGHVGLARVFEDPEIGKPLGKPTTLLLCQSCSMERQLIPMLVEGQHEPQAA